MLTQRRSLLSRNTFVYARLWTNFVKKTRKMLEEEIDSTAESDDFTVKYMRTLPDVFNDTVGQSLTIENTTPRNVIEVLGDFLGITDYEKNLASFWFLDILALQVLRSNEHLDDYSRVIFISWLAGEMNLIRDKKFSRDKFFDEMEILFTAMARKVARGGTIPHWNLISFGAVGMESEIEEEEHDLPASKDSELKMKTMTNQKSNNEEIRSTLPESSDSINSKTLLDIIIEATYDMYAGEVRYALVYAVFVEPIEIKVNNLPFTLRKPRPTRLADLAYTENFDLKLRKALQKIDKLGGKKNVARKNKVKNLTKDPTKEYPPEPPTSLIEENVLLANRSFLLPLLESKEAADIFEFYETTK